MAPRMFTEADSGWQRADGVQRDVGVPLVQAMRPPASLQRRATLKSLLTI